MTAKIYRNNTKRLANNHILLGDDMISAKILSYAFKYDKAKLLLKRLSKTTFVCSHTLMKTHGLLFSKKLCYIPIFSNNTLVFRSDDQDFEKFYKISERIYKLDSVHQDARGFRSLYPIEKLSEIKSLKDLMMPYAFSPLCAD
jgi:hypothetical protein